MRKRILTEDDLSNINKSIETIEESGLKSNKILVENLKLKEVQASTNDDLRTNVKKVADIRLGSKVPLIAKNDLITTINIDTNSVDLKWSSPDNVKCHGVDITEFKEDILVRNNNRVPQNLNDGIIIGRFSKNKHKYTPFKDNNVQNNQKYYYAVFSISRNDLVTKNGTSNVLFKSYYYLSELPKGTLIQDTNSKYYNKPIIWLKIGDNHFDLNETNLLSKYILCIKPFSSETKRFPYGTPFYRLSNIRQWLNSDKINWYSPQYNEDEPPTEENVSADAYYDEPGFLTNFSYNFKRNLIETKIKIRETEAKNIPYTLKTVTDKIFLLSSKEAWDTQEDTKGVEGRKILSWNEKSASPTREAIVNSNSGKEFSDKLKWWLRTAAINQAYSDINSVRYSFDENTWSTYGTYPGFSLGIRPALNINSNLKVHPQPDDNGIYKIIF